MSRENVATGFESPVPQLVSTRLLASAQSCAQRVQLSLEGLGCVSNLLPLSGVGLGLVASYLTGAIMDRSLGLASSERPLQAASGLSGSMAVGVDL